MIKYFKVAFAGFIFIPIPLILLVLKGDLYLQMQQMTLTGILVIIGF